MRQEAWVEKPAFPDCNNDGVLKPDDFDKENDNEDDLECGDFVDKATRMVSTYNPEWGDEELDD